MACGGGVNSVYALGGYIQSGMIAKGYIGAENIVIYGFGKTYYIAALRRKKSGCFMCSGAAKGENAVETEFFIVINHFFKLGGAVFLNGHHLKRLTDGA